ncbi:hypothetical protein TTHERM_000133609 (macronuclear) [Tetrahymena thermophila SB210]|uniref:Uncharacterized protein n=1 Tax=Tetrahymena thermophila (strain SB210) TaxID=312017 RepID=W7X832_TETTS|nr:hypothetical protein TTHERM_000133609 [Tetrahymena thermophila SB210]EWS73502.1 hypothetical protein TTHERM_000133609 [Tetrahymena thermophila SB210]|eukprot:XP_012653984.1 hypothetical protein TTHERM_000133609 [Tetrahymena thermophila SB210]
MNKSEQITETQAEIHELKHFIHESYQQVNLHFKCDDTYYINFDECMFVIDYLFSIYQVDSAYKQQIVEHIKGIKFQEKHSTIKRDKFIVYLLQVFKGLVKREQNITMEDLIVYIDTKLIMEIEDYWDRLKENDQTFISKDECIRLIKDVLQKFDIDYSKVSELVDWDLKEIHKFVFFQDFLSIVLQIAKQQHLQHKKYHDKQACSCQIF